MSLLRWCARRRRQGFSVLPPSSQLLKQRGQHRGATYTCAPYAVPLAGRSPAPASTYYSDSGCTRWAPPLQRGLQERLPSGAAAACGLGGAVRAGGRRRAAVAPETARRYSISRADVHTPSPRGGLLVRGIATSSGVDPERFVSAGSAALGRGDAEEAIRQFTLAVLANPGLPTGYCYRAECHVALGNYGEAIEDFQKATELAPGLVRLGVKLCVLCSCAVLDHRAAAT